MWGVPVCSPTRTRIGPELSGFNTLAGGVHCPGRRGKGVEEGISLRVHLDTTVALKRPAQSAAMRD